MGKKGEFDGREIEKLKAVGKENKTFCLPQRKKDGKEA